jgi:phosphatidylglycerol---prolipoprotein diacylglyceryl transferase
MFLTAVLKGKMREWSYLMEYWNNVYDLFDPVAFSLLGISVHWYGIMYVLSLLTVLYFAKWLIRHDNLDITEMQFDSYFIYAEIGVILGARLGYIVFYDTNVTGYLSEPWMIFNPFHQGKFIGIRGMSYHGAVIGFFVGTYLFRLRHKVQIGLVLDVISTAIPVGYFFGRIGNFLNKELVGRVTDLPIGIYVNGELHHPSQLYEALLEGVLVFLVIYTYRHRKRFDGELVLLYGLSYGIARFIAEFWREPDAQLGFICCDWMTKGQELSLLMVVIAVIILLKICPRFSHKNEYESTSRRTSPD